MAAQPPPPQAAHAVPAMTHLQTPPASGSRHQRLLSGARIIKSYVHESELRREASRFNNAPASLYGKPHLGAERDENEEDEHQQCYGKQDALRFPAKPSTAPETQSYRLRQHAERSAHNNNNQREEQNDHRECALRTRTAPTPSSSITAQQQQPLAMFFASQTAHRARRLSISAAHAAQVHANAAAINGNGNNTSAPSGNTNAGGVGNPVKPVAVVKRKLQMESVVSYPYRTTTNAILMMPGRGRNNNLSAKLDAVVKSSLWMRRKVVMSDEIAKPGGRGGKAYSPRHGSTANNHNNSNNNNGGSDALPPPLSSSSATNSNNGTGNNNNRELSQYELEKKVMAAFSRIVRMWRDRKRRSEAKTLTMMNGNKLRKDNGIQSAHVVGILSRRMIREVPALKFFDVEPESTGLPVVGSGLAASKVLVANDTSHHSSAVSTSAAAALNRNTPRGVCYTLDANGCRCIKMESGALQNSCTSQRDRHKKKEEVTIEKAMGKTLRRKYVADTVRVRMVKRVKTKRLGIRKLVDDFHKTGHDHAMKLQSQLALHQAEGEKMFGKRLAVLMSDDTSLPSYQAQKELYLARVRCRKADLMEKCQTLHALGELLQHVETEGELSGRDLSSGELHFLDLFRCVVEEDKVLTPLIANGIRQQLTAQDQQNPTVMELMAILRHQVNN